jgi:hypothetical protein
MLPNANDTAGDPRPKEPTTRFLFTEEMRSIFWVLLENASNWATLVTAMQYVGQWSLARSLTDWQGI